MHGGGDKSIKERGPWRQSFWCKQPRFRGLGDRSVKVLNFNPGGLAGTCLINITCIIVNAFFKLLEQSLLSRSVVNCGTRRGAIRKSCREKSLI